MYIVYYDDIAISADGNPKFAMSSATITQAVNSADSFVFTLPASHPYRDTPQPRSGVIRVKSGGKTLFVGDVVEVKTAFDNSRTFTCQGCLAWLADVCNTRTTAQTTVNATFAKRIGVYNSLCDTKRKIKAGNCTNRPTSIVRIFTPDEFITVFEYFARLVSAKGGLLLPRYEGDDVYLDYIDTKGKESGQQIVFGRNLLNLDDFISMAGTATAIYPVGKDGITIADVNNGVEYLINNALYSQYGMLATPAKYGTDSKSELLSEARLTLSSLAVINRTLELTAFDLHQLDASIDEIEIGDGVQVISAPHGLNTTMTCSSKTIDLINPANSTVALGKLRQSMSGIVSMGGKISSDSETKQITEFDSPVTFNSSVSTFGEVEVFGSTPHVDFHFGNSNTDYTSRIIENAAGVIDILAPNGLKLNGSNLKYNDTAIKNRLTAIESKDDVSLTPDSSRIKNVSYTAKYIKLLGAVLVRIYGTIDPSMNMNVGYDYDIMSIDAYLPNSTAALAVKCSKNAMAIAKKGDGGGAIQIRPLEAGINGYDVWITGFWFV